MGLDVYFRRDIANVLQALACASEGSAGMAAGLLAEAGGHAHELERAPESELARAPEEELLQAYQLGVRNTLVSVGLAFGLEPVGPGVQARRGGSTLVGPLWAEIPHER